MYCDKFVIAVPPVSIAFMIKLYNDHTHLQAAVIIFGAHHLQNNLDLLTPMQHYN